MTQASQCSVALVTASHLPMPDTETPLLVAALEAQELNVSILPWDRKTDWSGFDLVVVRTPWDYFRRWAAFINWTKAVESVTRLINPAALIQWNAHKRYLLELQAKGLPIIPSKLFANQPDSHPDTVIKQLGWHKVVIKPAVSASAEGLWCASVSDSGFLSRLSRSLAQGGEWLIQPFLPDILTGGEHSLVFVNGHYTHAVCKQPKAGDFRVQSEFGGHVHRHQASKPELELARAALAAAPAPTHYARVDLVWHQGQPLIMELELIEPELFLHQHPETSKIFARHIKSLVPKSTPRSGADFV